jgi:HPt (histidine-containing phosphotransfer) domain-containing protein
MVMQVFKFIDLTYLDSLIGDDAETKQVILSTLLEEVPEEIQKLKDALASSDWNELHEVSHKLKSTLAYIGNDAIFNVNQDIMMAARNMENLEQIPAWLDSVATLWDDIQPEVQDAMDEL